LALFEGIQNAFQHGQAFSKKQPVRVELLQDQSLLEAKIYDPGPGFDLNRKGVKFSSSAERGRGLAILRQLTDSLAYQRGKKENCLILRKKILPPDQRYQGIDLLHEVIQRLTQAGSLEKVYEVILKKLIEVFNVERASIMIYDPKEAALKVVAARGLSSTLKKRIRVKGGEGISGGVFLRSQPMLVEDLKGKGSPMKGRRPSYVSRSFISAPLILSPLKVGEERMGVVNLTDRRDGNPFTKKDLRLLSSIAGQSAAFIKIGQLLDQLKKAETFERELTVVREVQRKLLPTQIVSPPQADIAGEAILNERGGGDYFDVVRSAKGLFLVVADVTGHSLASALTMAHFRSAFRMLAPQHSSPRELLSALNSLMFEDLATAEHFICVSLIRFLPESGDVIFAGAGAVPLLIYGVSRKEMGMIPSQGYPLGVELQASYAEEYLRLSSGEGLIQCTDGVLDLPIKPAGKLGLEGVKELVLTHQNYPPAEMIARLRKILRRKLSMRSPPDDITVLVMKMR
jgi:sigma-B regulation protein RsbU (phosphoserine phosphatase)